SRAYLPSALVLIALKGFSVPLSAIQNDATSASATGLPAESTTCPVTFWGCCDQAAVADRHSTAAVIQDFVLIETLPFVGSSILRSSLSRLVWACNSASGISTGQYLRSRSNTCKDSRLWQHRQQASRINLQAKEQKEKRCSCCDANFRLANPSHPR